MTRIYRSCWGAVGIGKIAVLVGPTVTAAPAVQGRPLQAAPPAAARLGAPTLRRVLADEAVDRLAEQVRVPGVAGVLLHDIVQQAP